MPELSPLITDLSRAALAQWCQERGQAAYRADQIRRWIFGRRVDDFATMHDVPAALRAELADAFDFFASTITRRQTSRDGTEKLLLTLRDGEAVECVLMREDDRRTVCLSTQVGCGMGCVFCASGLLGVRRNLSTGEILDQVLRLDRLLGRDERITNVVVMGMGEPLANLRSLTPALETLGEKGGLGLGARRITVSTVGLPDRIRELADHGAPYNLAVSLHAPNDALRDRIVGINSKIGLAAVMQAADDYFARTGRRVTYEYVLLDGVNDEPEHARELAMLLRGRNAHVNVIPMNPVSAVAWRSPHSERTEAFAAALEQGGVNVTVRKRKGADIDAACGQLRLSELQPVGDAASGDAAGVA